MPKATFTESQQCGKGFYWCEDSAFLRKSRSKKYLQSTVLKRRRVIALHHETDVLGNVLQNSRNLGVPGLVWNVLGIVILFNDLGSTSSNLFVGTKSRFSLHKPLKSTSGLSCNAFSFYPHQGLLATHVWATNFAIGRYKLRTRVDKIDTRRSFNWIWW